MDKGFIDLGPTKHGGPPPPPPPAPMKPSGGQPMPNMQHGPNMPPMPMAPPKEMVPLQLRNIPFMGVVDLRQEFLSDVDKRRALTEFEAIKFEKLVSQDQYDDEGRLTSPTWTRVVRTLVPGLSTRQCISQIRHLDYATGSVIDKKNRLPPALQRHLDVFLNDLVAREHDLLNFQWQLAQFEEQVKRIDSATHDRRHSSKLKLKKHKSSSKKKRYERVSLTAYFKRSPRPEAPLENLYQQKMRLARGGMHEQHLGPPGMHPPMPPPGFQGAMPGKGQVPPNPNIRPPGLPPKDGKDGKAGKDGKDGKDKKGQEKVKFPKGVTPLKDDRGRSRIKYNVSVGGSTSSDYSDTDTSYTYETNTGTDSLSSRSSRYHHHHRSGSHHRHRPRSRHGRGMENSRHYGIIPPRQHQKHEQHYLIDGMPRLPPPAPAPPLPVQAASPPAEVIERIKEDAYFAGRADESLKNRIAEERASEARRRLSPRIIQVPRSSVRTVDAAGLRPRYADEDEIVVFESLSLDDHDDLDYRRRDIEDRTRRLEELDDEFYDRRRSLPSPRRRHSDYGNVRRQSASQIIHEPDFSNPFQPALRSHR